MKKTLLAVAALSLATQVSAAAFDGFYAGVNGGYGRYQVEVKDTDTGEKAKLTNGSIVAGLQFGYATTLSNCVYVGGEFGAQLSKIGKAKKKNINGTEIKFSKDYDVTAAAKVGYNFGSGVAYAGPYLGMAKYATKHDGGKYSDKFFVYGPLVGAEFKVTDCLTAGVEGRFELGKTKNNKSEDTKTTPKGFAVLARLNYAF